MDIDLKSLHPLEIRVLRLTIDNLTVENVMKDLSFNIGQCNQAFSWLSAKELITEKKRTAKVFYELTELGAEYKSSGTPEERMIVLLNEKGAMTMPEIAASLGLENKDIGSAFGLLSKEGILKMGEGKKVAAEGNQLPDRITAIRNLLDLGAEGSIDAETLDPEKIKIMGGISKKRGASGSPFRIIEREDVVYTHSASGEEIRDLLVEKGVTGEEIGAVTPSLLSSGEWKNKSFRGYSLNTPPSRVLLGRRNPYGEYLQWVKDKLASLGFEEFDGPLVETEFWNGDALFMPQFHSARDIHDVYYLKNPEYAKEIEQPWLGQVAETHENGWKTGSRGWEYKFDHEFTRRLVMRSQGTVLSSRQLTNAKIPGKYFGIARCFRYDQVDATHGADFYQTEGIVLGDDVNLKTLLGLLKMFAEEIAGAEEVRYVPGYFPFTEPSIEIHIKHPVLGWFELGGSGIFRPEVTEALGIHVPVLAWGLGIDRMALMHLGLNDLRELFTNNIENVRLRRRD